MTRPAGLPDFAAGRRFAKLLPSVSVEPVRSSCSKISDGMIDTSWDEQFLTRLRMIDLAPDLEFDLPIHNHHEFVSAVREVLPALTRRIGPEAATESPLSPICFHALLIHVINYAVIHNKQEIRESVWRALKEAGAGRFPGIRGRIPNFVGAERAADRLLDLDVWKRAQVLKCNPDSPQRPVRLRAMKEGKVVYMAVPRLRESKCFIELDPARLGKNLSQASSIEGAFRFGKSVGPEDMKRIDLIVCGTVAANRQGARIGKGGGYSDLEYGLAREARIVTQKTPIVTTVHDVQVINEDVPLLPHDIPVDYILTPTQTIETATRLPRPKGIYWEYLSEEQIDAIPYLLHMR
jgi:5-formyltetrahydrofolate cyclo-ligase